LLIIGGFASALLGAEASAHSAMMRDKEGWEGY